MTALNSVIVVTARMGSTRFPGKALAPLAGKPMLQWVVERCRASGFPVHLALPATKENDGLAAVAKDWAPVHRPDCLEADVLTRVSAVLSDTNADQFIRVTGDCPMTDPALVQECQRCLEPGRVFYAATTVIRTFARGLDVEAMDVGLVSAAHQRATKGYDREHVTPWIQRYVRNRRMGMTVTQEDTGEDKWQWSVDTPEELAWLHRMALIYDASGTVLPSAPWLRDYLHTHPDDIQWDRTLTLVR